MEDIDIAIIGGGTAGLFTAIGLFKELYKQDPNSEKPFSYKIAIFEKGNAEDKRVCPSMKNHTPCMKCTTCNIMEGLGGCGSFSDGKFPITNDFGGNLWEKCGKDKALQLMKDVDKINYIYYIQSGKPDKYWPKLYTSKDSPYKKICTQHNLHLLDADIRHLGTDIGQVIYSSIIKTLRDNISFYTQSNVIECNPIEDEDKYLIVTKNKEGQYSEFKAKKVVVAAGRSGSEWVKCLCQRLHIPTKSNRVDIGIRFECPNEIWSHITKDLYESKIVYKTKTYEDSVRTFCMNPSGAVVTEKTEGGITVNGHAFEDASKKTNNTNFALLVSQTFTEPFEDSGKYGKAIIALSNMLGGGVIVQRYGDLIRGKRSTKEHIKKNTVRPTLNAEPGDLSLVLPKRILDDILEMIQKLDHLVPGMTNDDNLLYGVELKPYNNEVETNEFCEAKSYEGLYFIGDGAGITHSLSQAAASGLYVAEHIAKEISNEI